MTLPGNFDNIEHLQKTWNQEHNRRVDRYFKDVQGSGDLSGVRASLKLACRALDNDNMYASWMRSDLFYNIIGYSRKNLAVVYGSKFDTAPPVAAGLFHSTKDKSLSISLEVNLWADVMEE